MSSLSPNTGAPRCHSCRGCCFVETRITIRGWWVGVESSRIRFLPVLREKRAGVKDRNRITEPARFVHKIRVKGCQAWRPADVSLTTKEPLNHCKPPDSGGMPQPI